jgi:hypothetical protein
LSTERRVHANIIQHPTAKEEATIMAMDNTFIITRAAE